MVWPAGLAVGKAAPLPTRIGAGWRYGILFHHRPLLHPALNS
jgi:hypothetical protein